MKIIRISFMVDISDSINDKNQFKKIPVLIQKELPMSVQLKEIEALNLEPEQTFEEGSSQISTIGDDLFFSDHETFNRDAPRDLSEKHDAYLYGATS